MGKSTVGRLPQTGDKWHLPFPTGKYPVIGYQDIMTGESKKDGVLIRLLYPAENQNVNTAEMQEQWANWYPHENYKTGLSTVLSPSLSSFVRILQYFGGDLHIPILENVKPSTQRQFPVIIFSHGMSSNRTTYSNLCSQFASHGFIVVIIEHRDGSAFATLYPSEDENGFEWLPYRRLSSFGEKMGDTHFNGRQAQLKVRVKEVRDVIDLITSLNNGARVENILRGKKLPGLHAQFQGMFDMENIIMAGHSYGGATVLFTLPEDSRIKMGICLDPWMFSVRDFDADVVEQPILFVNMEDFQCDHSLLKMGEFVNDRDKEVGRRRMLTFKETNHTDVSDLPLLLLLFPTWIISAINWVIPLISKVNPLSVHQATLSLCLDFINKHLTDVHREAIGSVELPAGIVIEEGVHLKGIIYT